MEMEAQAPMMEAQVPMNSWNDDRLDELSQNMKDGFARVDRRTEEGFARVDGELHRVNDRLDKVMYTLTATGLGLVGTVLVGVVGLLLQA
jgi:hypothetical protein